MALCTKKNKKKHSQALHRHASGTSAPNNKQLPCRRTSYLEPPDAGALLGGLLHGAVHEGDEHVEQQDVGEDDVADEEHVEDLLVLVVLGELHVAHADGELEKLHGGVGDVSVRGFETILPRVVGKKEAALGDVFRGGLYKQGDHGWGENVRKMTHTGHPQIRVDRSSDIETRLFLNARRRHTC